MDGLVDGWLFIHTIHVFASLRADSLPVLVEVSWDSIPYLLSDFRQLPLASQSLNFPSLQLLTNDCPLTGFL